MILMILVAGAIATTVPEDKQVNCKSDKMDMTNGAYFMAAVAVAIALLFIVFFRPKYLRMEAERNEKLSRSSDNHSTHD